MSTKLEPGLFENYAKAAPDEPLFVLLARDETAAMALRFWISLNPGMDEETKKEAERLVERMVAWRTAQNTGRLPAARCIAIQIGKARVVFLRGEGGSSGRYAVEVEDGTDAMGNCRWHLFANVPERVPSNSQDVVEIPLTFLSSLLSLLIGVRDKKKP